ncbi:MAG: hypothetical protein ACR2LR_13735 [Hassallia sp.]
MDLNTALQQDNATGAEVLIVLDAIATQLAALGVRYPHTIVCLCNEARMGADFTLPDAAMAVADAIDTLADY